MRSVFHLLFCLLLSITSSAQSIDRNAFQRMDLFVSSVGAMEDYPLRSIIDTFRTQNPNEQEMVRAIYMWMVKNIAFDSKAFHHPKSANNTASAALKNITATSEGYANLFKAMCDYARISCIIIPGFAKAHAAAIGNALKPENRHYWNAVNLRNTWFLIDATWGAGTTDARHKNFSADLTDAWMYPNRSLFALTHFPDNPKHQFLEKPVAKPVYNFSPVADKAAIIFDVFIQENARGKLRGRGKDCKRILFRAAHPEKIQTLSAIVNEVEYPVEYYLVGSQLYVDLPLGKGGHYPISLLVNRAPAYVFDATVSAVKKR